jgi:hypothetical protein
MSNRTGDRCQRRKCAIHGGEAAHKRSQVPNSSSRSRGNELRAVTQKVGALAFSDGICSSLPGFWFCSKYASVTYCSKFIGTCRDRKAVSATCGNKSGHPSPRTHFHD